MNASTAAHSAEQLIAANEDAAAFYRQQLLDPHNSGPRQYLTQRGFAALLDATRWTVGFAPHRWVELRDHLCGLGYSDQTLLAAGLLAESRRGTPYDRFRGRITFGIRNRAGELVGFTARSAPQAGGQVPKYLNTPSTSVFHKDAELFGLGELASQGAEPTRVAVVEGPLDAIAVDLAKTGSRHDAAALALCGTALSARHADHIRGLDPAAVVVVLDEDHAGCSGRERAYLRLREGGADLLCAPFPGGMDPAGVFLTSGAVTLDAHLAATRPLADQLVDDRLASWPNLEESAEARVACLRETATLVARMRPADLTREAARLPAELDLGQQTVTRELADCVARPCTLRPSARSGLSR